MATTPATTASNSSWLDSFMGVLGVGANTWLQYQDTRTQAQLQKLQSQNSFNQGQAQLAAQQQESRYAQLILWASLLGIFLLAFFVVKKVFK